MKCSVFRSVGRKGIHPSVIFMACIPCFATVQFYFLFCDRSSSIWKELLETEPSNDNLSPGPCSPYRSLCHLFLHCLLIVPSQAQTSSPFVTDAKICISITSIDSSSASLSPYHTFFSMPAAYRAYLGLCHRSRLAPKFAFPSALWGPSLPAVSKSKAKQSKQSRQAEAVTQYAQHSLPNPCCLDLLHPKRLQATSRVNISKLQRHVQAQMCGFHEVMHWHFCPFWSFWYKFCSFW